MKSNGINIVHISTLSRGGAATSAFRIHEALLNHDVNSHFLSMDNSESPVKDHSPLIDVQETKISFFDKFTNALKDYFGDRFYEDATPHDLAAELEFIKPLLKYDYVSLPFSSYNLMQHPLVKEADIIHLHWVAEMLDYPSFFTLNKKPVVWTLHDMNPFQGLYHYKQDESINKKNSSRLDAKLLRIKRNAIQTRKCRLAVVCPSRWLLKAADASSVFKHAKLYEVAYPLNVEVFHPSKCADLKATLNIPGKHTVFLFVAHYLVNYRKGFDLIVDAMKKIKHMPITLLVVGQMHFQDVTGLDIRFLGAIKDDSLLSKYYSIADATVIASREDNLPNVMLESMACGTPVLSFNVGGMAEIIQNGFNGLKARKISAEELSHIMIEFAKTKSKYSAEQIRNFTLENFSEKNISEKYLEVYKTLS